MKAAEGLKSRLSLPNQALFRVSSARSGVIITSVSISLDNQSLPEDLVRQIASRFLPDKMILFGSRARGDAGEGSDIDLLVLFPDVADPHRRAAEIHAARLNFPQSADIVVSTTSRFERYCNVVNTVYWPASHEGKVLYERTAGNR